MGALTETEIFDCMQSNLRKAAEHCEDLARYSRKGPTYRMLRDELKLIEGTCRQASAWREDTRWLDIGLLVAEAHKRAGDWLRGYKVEGVKIMWAPGHLNPMFLKLAANLRILAKLVETTKTGRTARLGMILPAAQRAPIRTQGRQMQVLVPPGMIQRGSGLVVPAGVA